ncbi:daptide-type RiPP biosynthesis methyltransferase [Microbacterium sp. NPDC089320]|uniref:daptide-type RiPP biosynthesis methyltransferase n=1 Tax=Microbacterium sp. NPDC089320 TaxID=3155182 RepID=UPI00342562E0
MTDAVLARIAAAGAVAKEQDLYAGGGAEFYDRLVGSDRAEVREVLALARDAEGPVLDIAAGSGRLTVPLVRSGKRVIAVDLSDDMLSRLRNALHDPGMVECVVADMREFSLGRRFDLVVIGATSVTVLDRLGRSRLYETVRRHLAPGGRFALTIAGGASARSLSVSTEQEISVAGPDGRETYLFSQQVGADGGERTVNWVRLADLARQREVTVFTSRLGLLTPDALARELVDAGYDAPAVSPVRTLGEEILLLTTTWAGQADAGGDDALA